MTMTSFCQGAKNAKFSVGPTAESPGPMLESVASEAVAAVTMSVSPTERRSAPRPQPRTQGRRSATTPRTAAAGISSVSTMGVADSFVELSNAIGQWNEILDRSGNRYLFYEVPSIVALF